ncbi:zinc finger, CCHC-type containing protein [Tanacetum coccineum]
MGILYKSMEVQNKLGSNNLVLVRNDDTGSGKDGWRTSNLNRDKHGTLGKGAGNGISDWVEDQDGFSLVCPRSLAGGYNHVYNLVNKLPSSATDLKCYNLLGFFGWLASIKQGCLNRLRSSAYSWDTVKVLQGVEFEVEPQEDHTFEVESHGNVDHVAGSHEVQTQDLMDYHSTCDREQHSARELFGYREDSNEAAFVVVAVDKIYAHESLTFNDTVACKVISKWKARLKEDMDARSDVDQSRSTLRVSQSRFYNEKLIETLLEGHSILSLEGSLSGDCDVKNNGICGSITRYKFMIQGCARSSKAYVQHIEALSITEEACMILTEATKEAIWLKGLAIELGFELKIVAGIATGALSKAFPGSRFQHRFEEVPQDPLSKFCISSNIESKILSGDTTYAVYLVYKQKAYNFQLAPAQVEDKNSHADETLDIYLQSPQTPVIISGEVCEDTLNPSYRPNIKGLPQLRRDGWMEVQIWEFKTNRNTTKIPMDIGNGLKASLWYDLWCAQSPLYQYITPRDIARERHNLRMCVADIMSNALRPRGLEIPWYSTVWFPHCIPRHAFHLWLLMRRSLRTQDKLRPWDVGPTTDLAVLRCSLCGVQMDSHEHIFFECGYSSKVGSLIRNLAGMENVPPILEDIVAWFHPMAAKRSFINVVGKLLFAAASYYIWLERNNRLFKNTRRSPEELRDLIMVVVRLKLVTLRFKNKPRVIERLSEWKMPLTFRLYNG